MFFIIIFRTYVIIMIVSFLCLIGFAAAHILHLTGWWLMFIGWISGSSGAFIGLNVTRPEASLQLDPSKLDLSNAEIEIEGIK